MCIYYIYYIWYVYIVLIKAFVSNIIKSAKYQNSAIIQIKEKQGKTTDFQIAIKLIKTYFHINITLNWHSNNEAIWLFKGQWSNYYFSHSELLVFISCLL